MKLNLTRYDEEVVCPVAGNAGEGGGITTCIFPLIKLILLFFSQSGNDPSPQQEASCNRADKAAFHVTKKTWMKEVRSTSGMTHLLTTQLTFTKKIH